MFSIVKDLIKDTYFFLSQTERTTRISHIVDKNRNTIGHVTDEHHRLDFIRTYSLFVNEREIDIQTIRNRCYTLEKKERLG